MLTGSKNELPKHRKLVLFGIFPLGQGPPLAVSAPPGPEGLVQPVLPVHKPGDDEGHHVVAGGVNHGGGGVHQIADGHQDGVGQFHLVGEEDGADDILADVAAAGDAAHAHGAEHRHQHHLHQHLHALKGHPEHPQHKGDFQHAGEAGPVHVHGGPQRQHHVAEDRKSVV